MANGRAVKDVMIDAFEYPHMPYWFTIRQAVGIMKKSVIESQKCVYPQIILVFDEKYNLMGSLTIRDILRGMEPRLLQPKAMTEADVTYVDEKALAGIEASLFSAEAKQLAEKPISDIMVPARIFVTPEDSVVKAAFLMERLNIQVLPVLEDGKKLAGVVRMIEVFEEVADIILAK
jgi:CBS domain-containing protein